MKIKHLNNIETQILLNKSNHFATKKYSASIDNIFKMNHQLTTF